MAIGLDACTNSQTNDRDDSVALRKQVDSLTVAVRELRQAIQASASPDSSHRKKERLPPPLPSDTVMKARRLPRKQKRIAPPASPIAERSDTIRYYYKGRPKAISVMVTPWNNGKRTLFFYNPSGELQYEQNDVRQSFRILSEISRFHDNGAVAELQIRNNPDAGIQFYKSTVTFGTTNEPLLMVVDEYPASLEQMTNNRYHWDKSTGQWRRQRETPVVNK
jgi:hypothetical protein